ncbi:hypothetical protein FACS1894106_2380 [Spirochaetia bacterium]|nr:hypothetical protein FACS1894106_2380 [Spirochaetia bacterium]
MKKLIALFIVLSLVVSTAFAEINFGAWGRAGWAPLVIRGSGGGEDGKDALVGVGTGPGWNGIGGAVGFGVTGINADKTMGFDLNLRVVNPDNGGANGGYLGFGDNIADVWVKPFGEILKITIGKYLVDDLRGKVGGASSTYAVGGNFGHMGAGDDEDRIFSRFKQGAAGVHFGIYPVDGLIIGVSFGSSGKYNGSAATEDVYLDKDGKPVYTSAAGSIYGALQVGAGYKIPNIGFARVQFIGGNPNDLGKGTSFDFDGDGTDDYTSPSYSYPDYVTGNGTIEAAFQLTAVQGLNLDVGFGFPLPITDVNDNVKQNPLDLTIGANYSTGNLGILGRVQVTFGGSSTPDGGKTTTTGLGLQIGVEPTYKIDGIGTLGIELGFGLKGEDAYDGTGLKNNRTSLGLGAFWRAPLAGATFQVGVAAALPLSGGDADDWKDDDAKKYDTIFTIPIVLTYSL